MQHLFTGLARAVICLIAPLAITSHGAVAGGNGSLYGGAALMQASVQSSGQDGLEGLVPEAMPLLYSEFQPVQLIGPSAEAQLNARIARRNLRDTMLRQASLNPQVDLAAPEPTPASIRGRSYSAGDLECLAEALYFEARGESRQGQAAVAEVILNRVDSGLFPKSVCGVINQPSQFSYTIGGRRNIGNKAVYARVREVAQSALAGAPRDLTGGATYFHTPAVRPAWSNRFTRTVKIGQHIFYRRGARIASN